MLTTIPELPDNVIGLTAKGEVTRSDYREVLEPAVHAALSHHEKVRMLYVIGNDVTSFSPGAMVEDAKVGVEHLARWERMAVVTDRAWIRNGIHAFSWIIPGVIRTYTMSELDTARAWITG